MRTYTKPVHQVPSEEAPQMKVTPSSTPPLEEAVVPLTQYASKIVAVEESSEEEDSAHPVMEKPNGFLDGFAALSRTAALHLGE
eukprot:12603521-Ditylum_brightwellii.AAC.1